MDIFRQPQAVKKKVEENGVQPKVDEIPEPYRPSEWLCAVLPRKAPYHPQMGDECMYFKQVNNCFLLIQRLPTTHYFHCLY